VTAPWRSSASGGGSGARGVVAAEPLVHAVQQVLGEAVPGTGQHLLEADDCLEAQPAGEGGRGRRQRGLVLLLLGERVLLRGTALCPRLAGCCQRSLGEGMLSGLLGTRGGGLAVTLR